MISDPNLLAWSRVWVETLSAVGALVNSVRGSFPLQPANYRAVFAVYVSSFTGGSLTSVRLRFGPTIAAANIATQGIDFTGPFAVNEASEFRNVVGAPGVAAPHVIGNPELTLPPVASVQITTPAGPTTLRYEVWTTYEYSPH